MISEAYREELFACARTEGERGDAMLRSFSGADQADSEKHFCARRVFVAIAHEGLTVDDAIAREDARWRAYAKEQAAKVAAAPKIKRGPSRGQSVISHRWVDPEAFTFYASHLRAMVRISGERAARKEVQP